MLVMLGILRYANAGGGTQPSIMAAMILKGPCYLPKVIAP